MSLEEAEAFAAEADIFGADLDYLEAATKAGGAAETGTAQASTQGPVVEDSPNVLKEVKNIKKKKATRKMKAKTKLAGAAAAEGAVQEKPVVQGEATQERPEAEAKAAQQDKAEPEVTDMVCSFCSLLVSFYPYASPKLLCLMHVSFDPELPDEDVALPFFVKGNFLSHFIQDFQIALRYDVLE